MILVIFLIDFLMILVTKDETVLFLFGPGALEPKELEMYFGPDPLEPKVEMYFGPRPLVLRALFCHSRSLVESFVL